MPNNLHKLGELPTIYVADDFLTQVQINQLVEEVVSEDALCQSNISTNRDEAGASCELPLEHHPLLSTISQGVIELADLPQGQIPSLRYRHYRSGDFHPPHLDEYQTDGLHLVATAMICLKPAKNGGETIFSNAHPELLKLKLEPGQLALWFNLTSDGESDLSATHSAAEVIAGEKITLTCFLYCARNYFKSSLNLPAAAVSSRTSQASRECTFYAIVDQGLPAETTTQLKQACDKRGIKFVAIKARAFDFSAGHRLADGAMLYNPSASELALSIEQALFHDRLATFYREPRSPHTLLNSQMQLFERARVNIPRTIHHARSNQSLLRRYVNYLGGFPVVCKVPGGSGGVGVMRLDSWPSLFSVMDQLDDGQRLQLSEYIPNAVHWRVIVIGNSVAAAYRNTVGEDDFRTYVSDNAADFNQAPSGEIEHLAIQAVACLNLNFGGVDVLEKEDGSAYVLESNFPCYFADPYKVVGTDVAGSMVDFLLKKANQLA